MNATWKCWLGRLMNRGAGAVRALGFTTRRSWRPLNVRRLGRALGAFAVSGALGSAAWAQGPGDEGVVRVGGGAAAFQSGEAVVRLSDPSASVSELPEASPAQFEQAPPVMSGPPVMEAGPAPRMADGYQPVFDDTVGYAMTMDVERILYRVGNTAQNIYGATDANGGSTNFNAFIPIASNGSDALWYFQPRGMVTNGGRGGINAGLGYRFYTPDQDRTYSSTFWWDGDGGHHAFYNQLGAHFSSVGRYLSWRGGFAIPIASKSDEFNQTISDIFFLNNNIGFDISTDVEHAYKRFELEAATPLPYFGRYGVELGVGVYHLTADSLQDATGISGRVEAQVTEDLWINGLITSDRVFGGNASINLEITLPDGSPSKWFRPNSPRDALFASDKRNYRVSAGIETKITQGVAIDPTDGAPITVAHIDPNELDPGNGSFENPFMSVLEFESLADVDQAAFDIIYVQPRTDGTDTNLNTTITLFDRQRLLGNGTLPSGNLLRFDAIVNGVLRTGLVLPGQQLDPNAAPVALPLLTNSAVPGTDVVRLANLNEVAGFTIDASGEGAGISGLNIDGFFIHDNVIQNANEGIVIVSDTTPALGSVREDYGIIHDNIIVGSTGTAAIPSRAGISVTQVNGTLDLLVFNNEVSEYIGEDANGNEILGPGEDVNGNGLIDPGIGIELIADGAGVINANDPLNATRPTGILNNTSGDDGTDGNGIGMQLTARNGGIFNAVLTGNDLSGNVDPDGAGLIALADNLGELNLEQVEGNTFNNNVGDGVLFVGRDGGVLTVPAFEDLDNDGIIDPGEDVNGNGILDVGFIKNTVSGNDDNGVEVLADNATVVTYIGSIGNGNVISGNGRLETLANQTDAIGAGVLMTTLNAGVVNGAIDGNTISGNAEAGIKIAPDGGVVALDSISGNTIVNNGFVNGQPLPNGVEGGDAIVFAPSNGGSFSVGRFEDNIIQGNRGAIIRVGGDGGIIDLGIIENTVFDRRESGTAGIIFDATNATITGIIRDNIFIGDADNADLSFGIGGEIRGGTLDLVIENNLFDTNSEAGIGLILTQSDDRLAPGTGTPLEGDSAEASLIIEGNEFINTLNGLDPRFDGSAISLQLVGQESDSLDGQNDQNGDGIPDAPTIPLPNGGDVTTNINPGPYLEAAISGNLIGSLTDVTRGNAGAGIDIRVTGDGTIGDLADIGSTIDRPELDGMTIGTAPGQDFSGNIIANNRGDGVRVRRTDSAIIDNFRISGNIIQNNLADGVDIVAENNGIPFGVEEVLDFTITENQILGNGFLSDGTQDTTLGATGRGIQMRAEGSSVIGIDILDNIISGNRMSGIEARTFVDSHTFISNNQQRDVIESVTFGDNGVIFGTWQRNIVTNNGFISNEDTNRNGILDPGEDTNANNALDVVSEGHGIAIGRIDFVDPENAARVTEGWNNGGIILPDLDGDGVDDLPILSILDNIINDNAEDGLHVYVDKLRVPVVVAGEQRTSRLSILRNDISGNGEDGLNIHNPTVARLLVDVRNNLITENGLYSELFQIQQAGDNVDGRRNVVNVIGDGIEIVTGGVGETIMRAHDNRIKDNNGRGVNIFTGSSASHLLADFEDNMISSNEREGFYLVNAPLNTIVLGVTGLPQGTPRSGYTTNSWLADFDSNHEMFTYGHTGGSNLGAAGNTPPPVVAPFFINIYAGNNLPWNAVTDLIFNSNIVDNNGSVVPDSDPNSAAGPTVPEDPYSTVGGLVIRIGTSNDATIPIPGFTTANDGGVNAIISDNRMSGNVGRDVLFDGFVATVPPSVDNLPDPLVRFDLQFRNNRGGSLMADGLTNIFYNNTAPAVAGGPNVKSPNPPFANADRLRDATSDLLGFPGLGARTLRVELDGATPDAFGNFIGNNSFNLIYSDFSFWTIVPNGTLFDPTLPVDQVFP